MFAAIEPTGAAKMIKKIVKQAGLEYIYNEAELYGIILRDSFESKTVTFFTEDNFSQQLGYLPHAKGDIIKPHIHKSSKREVFYTHEVLVVRKGKVKINYFNDQKAYVGCETLSSGDIILICGGGHGFDILEDSVLVEVKQGPYMGMDDKERFEGAENDTRK